MSSIVDINSVQGMTFYVHDWSAAQRQDYCYKVVIGSSILQDFTNIGSSWTNDDCRRYAFNDYGAYPPQALASYSVMHAPDARTRCTRPMPPRFPHPTTPSHSELSLRRRALLCVQ